MGFLPKTLGPKKSVPTSDDKADIIIFHCEFSSERGPRLMSLLRKRDRDLNNATYPALHYPECYLLSKGYKEFYENYPELCEPRAYVTINDPRHGVVQVLPCHVRRQHQDYLNYSILGLPLI